MRHPRLAGPPLALQIMGLLLGGLIIAQLVTLFLTMLLPPEPQPQYRLDEIAATLSGPSAGSPVKSHAGRPLQRIVQSGPPAFSGPGWLTSERSRHDLAGLLGRDEVDVQIFFFTPLPFAGTVPRRGREVRVEQTETPVRQASYEERHPLPPGFQYADYKVAQNFPTAGDARFPGGGFPGGFPGGGFPGAAVPGASLPNGTFRVEIPGGGLSTAPNVPGQVLIAPQMVHPFVPTQVPTTTGIVRSVPGTTTIITGPNSGLNLPSVMADRPSVPAIQPRPIMPEVANPIISHGMIPDIAPIPEARRISSLPRPHALEDDVHVPAPALPALPQRRPDIRLAPAPAPETVPQIAAPPPQAKIPAPPQEQAPVPLTPRIARGLFGMAPAPFIEGDFVAALRLPYGQWAVVRPTPEPFPNGWQRRVILWFLISFALVAPLGWIFARRLVRPIAGFAYAAEQLGRDPTAPILILEGPAEVGRAAHAFNRMQSRLRSFVDDRTAMVGAISHDLRTPLTRLRFRIEDVPDEQREGMLAEVEEMEQMISSVLAFIRDASEPGLRETMDLRSIVEDVVEDAVFIGKPVTLEDGGKAEVEVDPLGIRRLLSNLVENAVKYGDTARVRLFTDQQEVVAEVRDNGPGLPEEELERVFQPFYRTPDAHASNKRGSGLGLAVCRSIARAHGGDVRLQRGDSGLVAQLRLPLAYGATAS